MRQIRFWLILFISGLIISGVTAFPLDAELHWLAAHQGWFGIGRDSAISLWILRVRDGVATTDQKYPFMAYGTDWLAFAHLVIAIVFVGPWVDPVRNKWVVQFGLIACAAVLPLALIAGPIRGIPVYWRVIDCSFGVLGSIPSTFCLREISRLERVAARSTRSGSAQTPSSDPGA